MPVPPSLLTLPDGKLVHTPPCPSPSQTTGLPDASGEGVTATSALTRAPTPVPPVAATVDWFAISTLAPVFPLPRWLSSLLELMAWITTMVRPYYTLLVGSSDVYRYFQCPSSTLMVYLFLAPLGVCTSGSSTSAPNCPSILKRHFGFALGVSFTIALARHFSLLIVTCLILT